MKPGLGGVMITEVGCIQSKVFQGFLVRTRRLRKRLLRLHLQRWVGMLWPPLQQYRL